MNQIFIKVETLETVKNAVSQNQSNQNFQKMKRIVFAYQNQISFY